VTVQKKKAQWIRRLRNLRISNTDKQAVDAEYAAGFASTCEREQVDPIDLVKLANTLELKL
jgi:hypothetical protein